MLSQIIRNEPKTEGWKNRVLERAKNRIVRKAADAIPQNGGIVDAKPRTMTVGNVKIKNMRPLVNALVERRARELMAKQLIALTEMSKAGLLEPQKTATGGIRLAEPALM